DGAIADADSNASEDTFGRVAIDAGMLDSQTVGESLRKMAQNPSRSQRNILSDMGALSGDALERVTRLTLTRRVLRIFALPLGTYPIKEPAHRRLEGGPVEPRWSLYRGLRMHYDERRLDQEMAPLAGQAIKLAIDRADLETRFGFGDEERILLG